MFTPYYSIRSQADIDFFLQQLQDGAKAPKEVYIENMGDVEYAIPIERLDVSHTTFFVRDSWVIITAKGYLNVVTLGRAIVTVDAEDGFVNARDYSLVYAFGEFTVHAEEFSKCDIADAHVRYLGSDRAYGFLRHEQSLIHAPAGKYTAMTGNETGATDVFTRLSLFDKAYNPSNRCVLMYKAVTPDFETLPLALGPSLVFAPGTTVEASDDEPIRLAPNPYVAVLREPSMDYSIIQLEVKIEDLDHSTGWIDMFLAKRCRVNGLWFYGDPVETPVK